MFVQNMQSRGRRNKPTMSAYPGLYCSWTMSSITLPSCKGESLSPGSKGVSSDSVWDGGWLWAWAKSWWDFALFVGMTAISTLFFYPHCTMDESRAGLQGLVSQCLRPGRALVSLSGVCCWDLLALMCSAGLSSEVNYVRSVIPAQSVYAVSLFFLLL